MLAHFSLSLSFPPSIDHSDFAQFLWVAELICHQERLAEASLPLQLFTKGFVRAAAENISALTATSQTDSPLACEIWTGLWLNKAETGYTKNSVELYLKLVQTRRPIGGTTSQLTLKGSWF